MTHKATMPVPTRRWSYYSYAVRQYLINGITVRVLSNAETEGQLKRLPDVVKAIREANKWITDTDYQVKDCLITMIAGNEFRLFEDRPTLIMNFKDIDPSKAAHEMGHAIFDFYTSSEKAPKNAALRIVDAFLALADSKQIPVDTGLRIRPTAAGIAWADPTIWSKSTPEHPYDNADEFFASAREGFVRNEKGLSAGIRRVVKEPKVRVRIGRFLKLLRGLKSAKVTGKDFGRLEHAKKYPLEKTADFQEQIDAALGDSRFLSFVAKPEAFEEATEVRQDGKPLHREPRKSPNKRRSTNSDAPSWRQDAAQKEEPIHRTNPIHEQPAAVESRHTGFQPNQSTPHNGFFGRLFNWVLNKVEGPPGSENVAREVSEIRRQREEEKLTRRRERLQALLQKLKKGSDGSRDFRGAPRFSQTPASHVDSGARFRPTGWKRAGQTATSDLLRQQNRRTQWWIQDHQHRLQQEALQRDQLLHQQRRNQEMQRSALEQQRRFQHQFGQQRHGYQPGFTPSYREPLWTRHQQLHGPNLSPTSRPMFDRTVPLPSSGPRFPGGGHYSSNGMFSGIFNPNPGVNRMRLPVDAMSRRTPYGPPESVHSEWNR